VYWSVEHRRPQDYEYFKQLQPSVFKIMDGGEPDYTFARNELPTALVIARDWAMSEQHADMLRDPVGTGQRHAREWNEHQPRLGFDRATTLILGINEPHIWEPGVAEALRQYTIAMLKEAGGLGLHVGVMQLSVGWPNNSGPDTPPDWSAFEGVENAIQVNDGVLICHEYWANQGPSENWGWWAGRSLKCPWQVPIIIGECGIDMFVKDTSVGQQKRGWLGHMPPERYAAELAGYVGRMSADPRFVGCCVFASDFQAHEWYSFDVEPAYKAILATPIPDNKPPFEVHLPAISSGKPAYVAVSSGANLRDQPNLETSTVLTAVPFAEQVTVAGYDDDKHTWANVEYQGQAGWVLASLLNYLPPTQNATPPSPPSGDNFQRAIEWVLRWEGGYQNNPADVGNWTSGKVGIGENKGTNFGISAASYPNLDIRNLTKEQAIAIYERDYWQPSGAAALGWPACLLVMDTAVLHGVGTAQRWLAEGGASPYAIAAKRLRTYTKLNNWQQFGAAWVNRTADLLEEANR